MSTVVNREDFRANLLVVNIHMNIVTFDWTHPFFSSGFQCWEWDNSNNIEFTIFLELYTYIYIYISTHTQQYLALLLLKYEIYYKKNSRSALLFSYKKKNALIETWNVCIYMLYNLNMKYLWIAIESDLGDYTHWVKYQTLTYLNISPFLSHLSWFCLNLIHVWCNICTCTVKTKQYFVHSNDGCCN